MKKYNLIPLLILFSLTLFGQNISKDIIEKSKLDQASEDKLAIEKCVKQLFDGMRTGDSSMVSACFYSEVEMFTSYTNRDGKPVLKKGDLDGFIKAVGTPHDEIWDERIWDMEIRVNNNFAQVWMKYAFYVGGNFSHCGINALHLTRSEKDWKIFHLADTRQRKDCEEPK